MKKLKITRNNNPNSSCFKKVFTVTGVVSILRPGDVPLLQQVVRRYELEGLVEYLCIIFQAMEKASPSIHQGGEPICYIMEIVNGLHGKKEGVPYRHMVSGEVNDFLTCPVRRQDILADLTIALGGHETQLSTNIEATEDLRIYEDCSH